MKAKIEINNYGLIKHIDCELESGNLYFIKGSNKVGKTTFTRALLEIINGQSKNKNRLSFDAKEGDVTGIFNGSDDNTYTVKLSFNDKGKEVFTIITPDNLVSKRKSDISKIFQYNHFTIDEFFAWGLTTEGRRKQANIIKLLLPQNKQDRLVEIDKLINTKDGVGYIKRRQLKTITDNYNSSLYDFDEREQEILAKGEFWDTSLEKNKKELEEVTLIASNNAIYKERIENSKQAIINNDLEIKKLEEGIINRKLNNNTNKEILRENTEKLKTVSSDEEITELKNVVEQYQNAVNEYNVLLKQKENSSIAVNEHKNNIDELKRVTEKLETLRKESKEIISSSDIGIDNIIIDNGEALYVEDDNRLPFIEDNISYSQGGKIVLRLMAMINKKLPIWLIGKSAEYDKKSKEEMIAIAKEFDGIIVADQVIEEETDLSIEIYDNTKNGKEKTKELPKEKEIF